MAENRSVVLARRPDGNPQPDDFRVVQTDMPEPGSGQFLMKNHYISLDAGFRNWMNEGAGDNVLPAMPLDAPVMGLVMGEVVASHHPDYEVGDWLMARIAWQEFSVSDGTDFIVKIDPAEGYPMNYYLGVLGDTGLAAYFGMMDIGRPGPGDTVLVSAAGGAVGSIAGQIAAIHGARTVGIAGGADKCLRLREELGYDATIDHREPLAPQFASACPDGIDVYFDNVGGPLLETVLEYINTGARIAFCGAITSYGTSEPGPSNLFQLVTKEATMGGFLAHTQVERYPAARAQLANWLEAGDIVAPEYLLHGIEHVGPAFCDLFAGRNFGKTIVQLF